MIELRFPEDLYSGEAIDAAVKVYAEWAACELERDSGSFAVRLTAKPGVPEARVADELANYALGLTIEQQKDR
jgi:hypothetical protein